jgi:PAS domain S-box-containing protein
MISALALAAFSIGAAFRVFDRLHDWLGRRSPSTANDVFAVLVILTAVFAVFSVRTLLRAEREGARREEAENRYRTMVERVPAVAYTWDSADTVGEAPLLYVSPQIERLLGYSADDWMNDPKLWERRVHPDDREPILQAWADAAERGEPFVSEYRLRTVDGRWLWVRDEAVPISTGSRGRPVYQGVLIDITEQKRSEQRYRQLVEELPVVTYLADAPNAAGHHPLPYMAAGVEALTGRAAEAWMQRPETWRELIHPDDLERVLAEDSRTDRTGDRFEIEYRFVRDDGRIVWVHDSAVMVERDSEWPVWQGILEDITARREADEELLSAQDRYRSLVERLPATVYIDAVDEVSTALYVSPQYEVLTGYTADERIADPELWVKMLHPDDRERALAESARTNRTGDNFDMDYRIVTKSGSVVWIHDQAYLVPGQNGEVCWQGVLTDMTERKLSEAAVSRRDLILEAVGYAAERFLGATSWTDAIGEVLAHLGTVGGASRTAVYRHETDDRGGAGSRADRSRSGTSGSRDGRRRSRTARSSTRSRRTFRPPSARPSHAPTSARSSRSRSTSPAIGGGTSSATRRERSVFGSRRRSTRCGSLRTRSAPRSVARRQHASCPTPSSDTARSSSRSRLSRTWTSAAISTSTRYGRPSISARRWRRSSATPRRNGRPTPGSGRA